MSTNFRSTISAWCALANAKKSRGVLGNSSAINAPRSLRERRKGPKHSPKGVESLNQTIAYGILVHRTFLLSTAHCSGAIRSHIILRFALEPVAHASPEA